MKLITFLSIGFSSSELKLIVFRHPPRVRHAKVFLEHHLHIVDGPLDPALRLCECFAAKEERQLGVWLANAIHGFPAADIRRAGMPASAVSIRAPVDEQS